MNAKEIIKQKGFTLDSVGKAIGKTGGAISQNLNNTNVGLDTLREIAAAIGCQVGDFFTDETTPQPEPKATLVCPNCGTPLNIKLETE